MNFMWEYGQPVTSNELLELCTERTWRDGYLHVMLRSLEKKGMIERCGLVQYGTQYARQLRPTLTKEQYYVQMAFERGVDHNNFIQFAVAVSKKLNPDNTQNLIESLEDLIKDLESSTEE